MYLLSIEEILAMQFPVFSISYILTRMPISSLRNHGRFRPMEATIQIQIGDLTGLGIIYLTHVEAAPFFANASSRIRPTPCTTGSWPNITGPLPNTTGSWPNTTGSCVNTTALHTSNTTFNFNPTSANPNLSVFTGGAVSSQMNTTYLSAVLCAIFAVWC
jgi:hypothetical protein